MHGLYPINTHCWDIDLGISLTIWTPKFKHRKSTQTITMYGLMLSWYAEINVTLEEEKLKLKPTLLVQNFGSSQNSETTEENHLLWNKRRKSRSLTLSPEWQITSSNILEIFPVFWKFNPESSFIEKHLKKQITYVIAWHCTCQLYWLSLASKCITPRVRFSRQNFPKFDGFFRKCDEIFLMGCIISL